MKQIAMIGCSFTRGWFYNDQIPNPDRRNLPTILAELLPQYRINDYSRFSNTLPFQVLQLEHILSHSKPDLVIFQATTGNRITFSRDFDESIRKSGPDGLVRNTNLGMKNFWELPPNYTFSDDQSQVVYDHAGAIHCGPYVTRKLPESEQARMFEYHAGWVISSLSFPVLRKGYMLAVRRLLEESGVPFIFYQQIVESEYCDSWSDIVDFIAYRELPELKNHIVDNGNHLGLSGNYMLAKQLLIPRIEEKLIV